MLKDYVVINNVLSEPEILVNLSKNLSYIKNFEHVNLSGIQLLDNNFIETPNWKGFRSPPLHEVDNELQHYVFNEMFFKIFKGRNVSYEVTSHLHFLSGNNQSNYKKANWWHQDLNCIFAGLIYLSPNPPKNSGTNFLLNNDSICVENTFNRLIFYRSDIFHRPQKGFGTSVDDARLTLTFFINKLSFF